MSEFKKWDNCDPKYLSTNELLDREDSKRVWIAALKWVLEYDELVCERLKDIIQKELKELENE